MDKLKLARMNLFLWNKPSMSGAVVVAMVADRR